jgi:hypothetical protein
MNTSSTDIVFVLLFFTWTSSEMSSIMVIKDWWDDTFSEYSDICYIWTSWMTKKSETKYRLLQYLNTDRLDTLEIKLKQKTEKCGVVWM